jgi:hypothetical protein
MRSLDAKLVFDKIIVSNGSIQEFSVEEFLALPLHKRIRYMLQHNLQFFLRDEPVDRRAALHSLRKLNAA